MSKMKKKIKSDIIPKKKWGQNFLQDDNILNKIVNAANVHAANVIEIGPGLGALTNKLIINVKKIVCYEIDPDIVQYLNEHYNYENLTIINKDFLKVNLNDDIKEYFNNEKVILVANLPYYITTAILTKILEETSNVDKMIVMMQKEVALRICGKPNSKDYNCLSVLIQYFAETNILFDVSPNCFYPTPAVDSSVVEIKMKGKIKKQAINLNYFLKFNRNIFAQRRKTVINNIINSYSVNRELIEKIFKDNDISITSRAEDLSVNQIVDLANAFFEIK